MNFSNIETKSTQLNVNTATNTATNSAELCTYNSRGVKKTKATVQPYSKDTEPLAKITADRLVKDLSVQSLTLNLNDDHSKSFNEVVRRIKSSQQVFIMINISKVTGYQLGKIIQCCYSPSLLITSEFAFLNSTDFPYVALRALRDHKVNVHEFSTLVSLHCIYKEMFELTAGRFEIKHKELFDKTGKPNKESWESIKITLSNSNNEPSTFIQYNIEEVISKVQIELKSVRPIEAGFWHHDIIDAETSTVADRARVLGSWALSRYDDQEMIPSITMRQVLVEAAFDKEAHRINPVIGISSADDIRLGGVGRYRDFALPFPGVALPKTADYLLAPTISDFHCHDNYHLSRVSLLTNKDADVYIAIGDALLIQINRYGDAISELKNICRAKLKLGANFKKYVDKMSLSQNKKALESGNEVTCKISKLIGYLSHARQATEQFKDAMYDLEMCCSSYSQDYFDDKKLEFHLRNIIALLNYKATTNGRVLLNGMPAELAGRVVLPIIYDALDNPPEEHHMMINAILKAERKYDDARSNRRVLNIQKFERAKRFLACLKSGLLQCSTHL